MQIWCQKFLDQKEILKKKRKKSVKSLASGKENVWFPDSLDFENLPDFRTEHDVQ